MNPDFLVVGAGVAGLRAAIELARVGQVLVVAKDSLRESSSEYAQGGIAAALSDDDEVELHEQDTLFAGDGLCDRAAVRTLVEDGPAAIQELIQWGAAFDRESGKLVFAREGAHSRNRVLHAGGDSTGHEIARTLYEKAASLPNVRFQSFAAVTDLLLGANGQAAGALVFDSKENRTLEIRARAVLLATGGLGRVYLDTTNPDVATGDGVAMAYRAGAVISDIEFVQFHPTALHVENAPRFLLSEALRGEGARLRNDRGERFMERYHELGELAPRDVVSRSIVAELRATGAAHVFLDLTHLPADHIRQRFPRIYQTCLQFGVDLTSMPAPVHPAAHYAMGGVRTDYDGRTSIDGLYAAGEVACTGVHGANRLASNSLLEGVVFGARAGRAMLPHVADPFADPVPAEQPCFPAVSETELRARMWRQCGIVRDGADLDMLWQWLQALPMTAKTAAERRDFDLRNLREVDQLIVRCAIARRESRGGHFRNDYPAKDPAFEQHSAVQRSRGTYFLPRDAS